MHIACHLSGVFLSQPEADFLNALQANNFMVSKYLMPFRAQVKKTDMTISCLSEI